ncbi:peptidoglycan-binding protein, partial [Ideonella sp.]|uniref:peptidoglycan-binding domain-containing protein n=1 Tax=Ideonella sp. TaxID=1929293 RepID=UPI003BB7B80A
NGPPLFDSDADRLVHRLCRGVPRRINVLCDRALRLAHEAGLSAVDNPTVRRAADDVFGRSADRLSFWPDQRWPSWPRWLAGGGLVAALLVASNAWYRDTADSVVDADTRSVQPTSQAGGAAAAAASSAVAAPLQLASGTGLAEDLGARLFGKPAMSEAEALHRLARLWGVELGPGEPCAAAAAQGLACYSNPRGLSLVRQLDRPGLMTLSDEQGRIARVLVLGMDDSAVRVLLNGQTVAVPLSQLAWWWRGDFSTFWRTPPGQGGGTLENNPALSAWLAEHLPALDGEPAEAADPATLRTRVAAFQQRNRLKADGEAGPLTLMLLNRASGVIEPTLERGAVSVGPSPARAPSPSGPAQPGARPG